MNDADLVRRLEREFPDRLPPEDSSVLWRGVMEIPQRAIDEVSTKSWTQLDRPILVTDSELLSSLSARGVAHVLPAYLRLIVEDYVAAEEAADRVLHTLAYKGHLKQSFEDTEARAMNLEAKGPIRGVDPATIPTMLDSLRTHYARIPDREEQDAFSEPTAGQVSLILEILDRLEGRHGEDLSSQALARARERAVSRASQLASGGESR